MATPVDHSMQKEYAFEMAASSIRFGPGCTKEVGMDFTNLGAKKVMVVTDSTVLKLDAMKQVQEGLDREGIQYEIYSKCRVEPKDYSYVPMNPPHIGPTNSREASRRQSPSQNLSNQMPSSPSEEVPSSTPQS